VGVIKIEFLNSKILTYSFSFVISLQILSSLSLINIE